MHNSDASRRGIAGLRLPVIPGRGEASNPESRDSGSGAGAPSRNDGFWIASGYPCLYRQEPPDRRDEENRKIDRKADAPQDRAKGRTIAEIGKDIGDAHDQKKNSQFIDQALRA